MDLETGKNSVDLLMESSEESPWSSRHEIDKTLTYDPDKDRILNVLHLSPFSSSLSSLNIFSSAVFASASSNGLQDCSEKNPAPTISVKIRNLPN